MKVLRLGLPARAVSFLQSLGYEELYPPQADSVRAGLLQGESLFVSAPTASGKTLIAMMAMLSHLSSKKTKVIYLSPLRALVSEKYEEFKAMEQIQGGNIRVASSSGDYAGPERRLESANILVFTNERLDSIIRHDPAWIDEIGLVIADEVHLIGDSTRGPTLEMILTRMKRMKKRPQMVALSATVTNAGDMAGWLGCKLVHSRWRPVPLVEGYCIDKTLVLGGKTSTIKPSTRGAAVTLGMQTVQDGGQALLFAQSRPNSVSLAVKASVPVSKMVTEKESKLLHVAATKILKNEQTELVKKLAELVKSGVAFHHAGLNQNCRETVEKEFRERRIKILTSTPTLAAGVNLPAKRVVISTLNRYDAQQGRNVPIPILEYKQLCGRAGRPQYDERGEAVIVSSGSPDPREFIRSTPEPILSEMATETALRIHILSIVVTDPGLKQNEIVDFFEDTFGGHMANKNTLEMAVSVSLIFLESIEMLVKKGGRYAATRLGRTASRLYIDPYTASQMREQLEGAKKGPHTLGLLHLITTCDQFYPLYLRGDDHYAAERLLARHRSEMLRRVYWENVNRSLLALYEWISETGEVPLAKNLGVESGDMRRMVDTANWLAYCLRQIAKLVKPDMVDEIDELRTRIRYGIRAELSDLVALRNIGRVRARALYKNKIRTRADVRKASESKLARIPGIGKTVASSIKLQAGRAK